MLERERTTAAMQGELTVVVHQAAVRDAREAPKALKVFAPSCYHLTQVSDIEFRAMTETAVGSIEATFKDGVKLTDQDLRYS